MRVYLRQERYSILSKILCRQGQDKKEPDCNHADNYDMTLLILYLYLQILN